MRRHHPTKKNLDLQKDFIGYLLLMISYLCDGKLKLEVFKNFAYCFGPFICFWRGHHVKKNELFIVYIITLLSIQVVVSMRITDSTID